MRIALPLLFGSSLLGALAVGGCSVAATDTDTEQSSAEVGACTDVNPDTFRFPHGHAEGHPDPLGAGPARQARAGRVKAAEIFQPPDARHKVRAGDFVLANDKVAVYIEDVGHSDGYFPFGGEILSLDKIGADGKPQALSHYGETVLMFGLQTIAPDRVTVLADGSDGGPAIVRASGILKLIPSLDAFLTFFPDQYGFPAAVDYVLEPGAEKVTLRYSVANTRDQAVSFVTRSHFGVFQASWSQTFAENGGFGKVTGQKPFIAWEQGDASFLIKPRGGKMQTFLATNGLEAYQAPTIPLRPCEKRTVDYADLVIGGPGIDGLLEAKRRALGEAPWREVRGVVRESGGGPLAGAMVHATGNTGYLTRAVADGEGKYVIHVPSSGTVNLTATSKGWAVPVARPLVATESEVDLTLPKRATIEVTTTDAETDEELPVRIQVIPDAPIAKAPASFGLKADEPDDRLYRAYAIHGKLSVPVPPGGYRVVVSRGYEYELFDAPVLAEEGKTARVTAKLRHSVKTPESMCADFHIHSAYSVDSDDPVLDKVHAALADGLEIPVSSEHEYVIDFQPVIEQLGMKKWAFGVASEELTTFKYGHFGVFPLVPQPDQTNNGAIDWTYQTPATILPTVEALPSKPLLIVNHPRGSMGYFDQTGYDAARGTGQAGLWSDAFGAIEVFNDSDFEANRGAVVADWFGMLNAGRKLAATGASDSHHLQTNPVGYPSTCLRFGHDDPQQLTPNAVRDALRNGAAVVSGGITLTAQGPDGTTPGGDSTAGVYKVTVAAPGWITPASVEVIVDGRTTQTIALDPSAAGAGPGKRWELSVPIAPAESRSRHWVVFHAKGEGDLAPLHPGRKPFAVTNPIYF